MFILEFEMLYIIEQKNNEHNEKNQIYENKIWMVDALLLLLSLLKGICVVCTHMRFKGFSLSLSLSLNPKKHTNL